MTVHAVTSASVLLGAFDVSPFTGDITDTPGEVRTLPYAVFGGGGYQYNAPAIKAGTFGLAGFGDYTAATGISAVVNASTPGTQYAYSVAEPGTTAGDTATFGRGIVRSVGHGLKVADLPTIAVGLECDTAYVQNGYLGAPLASRTTSGLTGTAIAMTGPSATQRCYAALHVTAAAGTDLVVKVQSDSSSGFGSPTDRITFSTVSATGWQFSSVAGDLSTETHWRVVATIASSTFSFACLFGVA